jgi:uncharacterized protein (DUF1684 family)
MQSHRPSRIEGYRQRRNDFFRSNENSPLTDDQKRNFVPLEYFPEDPALIFILEPDTDVPHDPVELPTTTGTTKEYIPHARLSFEVEGEQAKLVVYREPERGRLVIPFRDTTNNVETYGAGRSVDPQERPDGKLVVDFNYAYGPYCQYNDNWVCTVPPLENWLKVPIRAGEKMYPNKESAH